MRTPDLRGTIAAATFRLDPAVPLTVRSWYFDDRHRFPAGTIDLDGAYLMRPTTASWRADERLHAATSRA